MTIRLLDLIKEKVKSIMRLIKAPTFTDTVILSNIVNIV